MIVLDLSLNDSELRFITPAECERLKVKPDGSPRLVLAYLSVGEVDTKRWYWPSKWLLNPPDWVGAENPNWAGARSVQYWNPQWRSLVFEGDNSILDVILDIGFDGVVLDRVDAYADWEANRKTAKLDMVDLVSALAEKGRARDSDFLIIAQNAEPLLIYGDFVLVLDGHNKESLITGLSGPNTYNTEEDVNWSLNFLRGLQDSGKRTFATEYLTDMSLISDVRSKLTKLGFVPFFGVRALDRLPVDSSSGATDG
jgi:cysteinyl-tRNA synthetase